MFRQAEKQGGELGQSPNEPREAQQATPNAAPLRLAVISTPRSGNTWLRHMLATLYGLDELARHRPWDVPWNELNHCCILQIHWHRVEPFISQLHEHAFRVVVLARHPLDMLLSLLNWVNSCPFPSTVWTNDAALDGDRGTEVPLLGASPTGPAFVDWACSPRAEALLSVSLQWSDAPDAVLVRFEDLVRSATGELDRVVAWVGSELRRSVSEVAATCTWDGMRKLGISPSQHFWQGQPGLWKRLLPPAEARRIADRHAPSFERLGYVCDPDETLTPDQAAANWRRLTVRKPHES